MLWVLIRISDLNETILMSNYIIGFGGKWIELHQALADKWIDKQAHGQTDSSLSPSPSLREEECFQFSFLFLCLNMWTTGRDQFWPWGLHIWTNLVVVHQEMLHTKYQSSMPSNFFRGFQIFCIFFICVDMATRIMSGIKFFEQVL